MGSTNPRTIIAMASSSGPLRRDRVADSGYRSFRERSLENREKDLTLPWRHWLRERYARYWYLLGVFLLDLLVAGTILQFDTGAAPETWQYALAIVVVIVLAYPECLGYRRLWPPHPME